MSTPSQVGAEASAALVRTAKAIGKATKDAMKDAADVAKAELKVTSTIVPGGDARFSNMRGYNHGGKLAVKSKPYDGGVTIIPRGPWKLAESGRDPGRRNHPGTRSSQGRKSWTKGQEATFQRLGREVPEHIGDEAERAFGG
jgi:hypothetical protein